MVQLVILCIQMWIFAVFLMYRLILPHPTDTHSAIIPTCKMHELMWELPCHKNNAALYCLMHPKCWSIPVLLLNTEKSKGGLSMQRCRQCSHQPHHQVLMTAVRATLQFRALRPSIKKSVPRHTIKHSLLCFLSLFWVHSFCSFIAFRHLIFWQEITFLDRLHTHSLHCESGDISRFHLSFQRIFVLVSTDLSEIVTRWALLTVITWERINLNGYDTILNVIFIAVFPSTAANGHTSPFNSWYNLTVSTDVLTL